MDLRKIRNPVSKIEIGNMTKPNVQAIIINAAVWCPNESANLLGSWIIRETGVQPATIAAMNDVAINKSRMLSLRRFVSIGSMSSRRTFQSLMCSKPDNGRDNPTRKTDFSKIDHMQSVWVHRFVITRSHQFSVGYARERWCM